MGIKEMETEGALSRNFAEKGAIARGPFPFRANLP